MFNTITRVMAVIVQCDYPGDGGDCSMPLPGRWRMLIMVVWHARWFGQVATCPYGFIITRAMAVIVQCDDPGDGGEC
jgi:hypothetical protein